MESLKINYETKLKEAIAKAMRYERTLKKNETDEGFRMTFATNIIKDIDPRYYEALANAIEATKVVLDVTYNKTNCNNKIVNGRSSIKIGYFDDSRSFAHECGHLVDAFNVTSTKMNLYSLANVNGSSLYSTLNSEFNENKDKLFKKFRNELSASLDQEFGIHALDLLEDFYSLLLLKDQIISHATRGRYGSTRLCVGKPNKEQHLNKDYVTLATNIENSVKNLCADGSIQAYYNKYYESESYKKIVDHYDGLVSDILGSSFDLAPYGLSGHKTGYFENGMHRLCREFFAEVFSFKLTNDEKELAKVKRFFPKSFSKCIEVFDYVIAKYSKLNN